jgi:hypothetical protein
LSALVSLCLPANAQRTLIMAISGDPSPDGNGTIAGVSNFALTNQYAAFSSLLLNSNGGTSDDFALFTVAPSGISLAAREGQSAGGNGTFSFIGQFSLNNQGDVAFYAPVIANTFAGADDDEAIFRRGKFGLTQIVRENQTPPGGLGVFNSFTPPSVNSSGSVAFWGAIRNASTPLISTHGIYVGSGGGLTKIARTYEPEPGGNGTFSGISSSPKLSDTGYVAFTADLTGTTGGANDNSGIYLGNGTSLATVVREGQGAPGGNGVFDAINFPWLNNDRTTAFYSTLRNTAAGTSDNVGIFTGTGGPLTQIVRTGQPSPDGNGVFTALNNTLSINKNGDVAFTATLGGTSGVFLGDGTTMKTIVRSGQPTPEGQGSFGTMLLAAVNDTGTVAFTADLTDGKRGIYLADGRETILVGREGDTVAGSTIKSIGFDPKTFNDFREVAYQAILQDGRWSVLLFTPRLRWRDNGNGVWDDNSKWTVSLRPADYTRIEIDPQIGGTITGPNSDAAVLSLDIGGTTTGIADLDLLPNVTLTVQEKTKVKPGGKLSGKGELVSDVLNESIIAPGNSPGTLVIDGDLEQTATGILKLELAGVNPSEHDLLSVTGTFTLGGQIDLTLLNGFAPQLGDTFELIEASDIIDNGYVVTSAPLGGGLSFQTSIEPRGAQEVVVASVVPEPGSLAILLAAVPLFARRSSRKAAKG